MMVDSGRDPAGQALVASDEAPAGLHPSGFDPSRLGYGLSRDLTELLVEGMMVSGFVRDGYFVAADLTWSQPGPTGAALTRLAERGLLHRSNDPSTWGRSRYHLTPKGEAIAMEARRGATPKSDATAEGGDSAGPQDIAHPSSPGVSHV
jgi:hypothetical protein